MSVPFVKTEHGRIKGFIVKNVVGGEYLSFNGIPYAEPPIGDLRFKDPRPPKSWNGVRDCQKVYPKATQVDIVTGVATGTEDCLYLNVATNSLIGKRPVMVWIHGGGFVMGSPHGDFYAPDYLLKGDIVFVGIGYRLGCFGFLNLGLPDAAGNQGMKDQIAGLKWVKKNIRAFGGDPENVTIFGESAGGASVHLLTLSPLAKGLFHRAIMQSGVAINPWAHEANHVNIGLQLAEKANKKTDDPNEALKFLMTLSTTQLLEAQRSLKVENMEFNLVFNFVPTVDRMSLEPFMPESPGEIMKRSVSVPMIIGFNSDEGILVMLDRRGKFYRVMDGDFATNISQDLRVLDTDRVRKFVKPIKEFYFGDELASLEEHPNEFVQLKGDMHFVNGIQEVVDVESEKSTPMYLYRFSHRASYPTIRSIYKTELEGACHGEELGALFQNNLFMPNQPLAKGTSDYLIMQRMTRMWTNFAKTGNPTPEVDEVISCKWEPVTKNERNYIEIGEELTPGVNPGEASWKFWKPILRNV